MAGPAASYELMAPDTFSLSLQERRPIPPLDLVPSINAHPQIARIETLNEAVMWSCCFCHAADPNTETKGLDAWLPARPFALCKACGHAECGLCFRFTGTKLRLVLAGGGFAHRLAVAPLDRADEVPWFDWAGRPGADSEEPVFREDGPRTGNCGGATPVRRDAQGIWTVDALCGDAARLAVRERRGAAHRAVRAEREQARGVRTAGALDLVLARGGDAADLMKGWTER